MHIITQKTISLMKNLYSLKGINETLSILNGTQQITEPENKLILPDYYLEIFEESISLIIELSILLRRACEKIEKMGISVNSSVKYSNVGTIQETKKNISFSDILSKIVHASRITFVMQEPKGSKGYAFAVNRKSFFTNIATIRTTDKKGKSFLVDIDLKKFCINAIQIGAELYIFI